MFKKNSRILVLAPHIDDGEIGCGGTIHKLSKQGHSIHYVAFSSCAESLPSQFTVSSLIAELKEATHILGIAPENLTIFDFKVRRFTEKRQDILENLVAIRRDLKPDYIFAPSVNDIHQDHATIAHETIRAFKNSTILGYEEPWNHLTSQSTCFIELTEENLTCKVEALKKYKSQQTKACMKEEFIRSLAVVRGVSVNKRFAEVFDIVRLIID